MLWGRFGQQKVGLMCKTQTVNPLLNTPAIFCMSSQHIADVGQNTSCTVVDFAIYLGLPFVFRGDLVY